MLFNACYGYFLQLLLPLLPLWPGMVGLSHPPCSDDPTSLSQQSYIHPNAVPRDFLGDFLPVERRWLMMLLHV